MALTRFSKLAGLAYDSDFFTEADIENLFGDKPAIALAAAPVLTPPAGLAFSDTPSVGEIRNAIGFVSEQVANGTFEPDLLAGLDLAALSADAEARLSQTLVEGTIPEDVLEALHASLNRVAVVEVGDEVRLMVDGEALMTARGDMRAGAVPVFELAMVILDIIFVVLALIAVAVAVNTKIKNAVAEIVKKTKDGFFKLADKWIAPIKAYFASFKSAASSSALWSAIKSVMKQVALGLARAIEFIWNYLWKPCKAIFQALISSGWALASAIFSLGAFVIGLIGTAGAILGAALLGLAAAVCALVGDSINLSEKLGSPIPASP
jgi:hypothetical protein